MAKQTMVLYWSHTFNAPYSLSNLPMSHCQPKNERSISVWGITEEMWRKGIQKSRPERQVLEYFQHWTINSFYHIFESSVVYIFLISYGGVFHWQTTILPENATQHVHTQQSRKIRSIKAWMCQHTAYNAGPFTAITSLNTRTAILSEITV